MHTLYYNAELKSHSSSAESVGRDGGAETANENKA